MRDPRYDILFEPVQIGPVTARNRFYQVPHCNGMGYRDPSGEAYMRRVKAEGGWAVVCTEQVEIHPTSDIGPFIELRMWDEQDLPGLARIADMIHQGGALAGIELAHNGLNSPNLISREVPLAPQNLPVVSWYYDPVQARAMTKIRYRRYATVAPRRGSPFDRGRLRHRLRLRRTRHGWPAPLPVPPVQQPHRRVRWQPDQPGSVPARGS